MFDLYISTASRSLLQQTEVTDVSHDQCHVTLAGIGLVGDPGQSIGSALFTSIPVLDAVSVIKDRINQDKTRKDRCELSVNQITTQLEICLNPTYLI